MEYFDWSNSKSKENVEYLLKSTSDDNGDSSQYVADYKDAILSLFDDGKPVTHIAKTPYMFIYLGGRGAIPDATSQFLELLGVSCPYI